jgi:hypothetical protein
VYEKIQDYAAEGTVFYNDDTTVTVLGLTPQQRAAALGEEAANTRSGIFTSGIVSYIPQISGRISGQFPPGAGRRMRGAS